MKNWDLFSMLPLFLSFREINVPSILEEKLSREQPDHHSGSNQLAKILFKQEI